MRSETFIEAASLHFSRLEGEEFEKAIIQIGRSDLPTDDLRGDVFLYGLYEDSNEMVGTAGLEIFNSDALLRSVSVVPDRRKRGYGRYLVRGTESYAKAMGVLHLYLLTTTAADFFEGCGFVRLNRDFAPISIRNTMEFSALCPSSAVFMKKNIGNSR